MHLRAIVAVPMPLVHACGASRACMLPLGHQWACTRVARRVCAVTRPLDGSNVVNALFKTRTFKNINLDQLTPKNWGLTIPLSFSSGETLITPEYDPFYEDLKLDNRIQTSKRISQRDSIRNQSTDYTRRKSISLIGIRKNSNGKGKS